MFFKLIIAIEIFFKEVILSIDIHSISILHANVVMHIQTDSHIVFS